MECVHRLYLMNISNLKNLKSKALYCHTAPRVSDSGMFWIWGFQIGVLNCRRLLLQEEEVHGGEHRTKSFAEPSLHLQPRPACTLLAFLPTAPSTPPTWSRDLLKLPILTTLQLLKLKILGIFTSSSLTQIDTAHSPGTALHF